MNGWVLGRCGVKYEKGWYEDIVLDRIDSLLGLLCAVWYMCGLSLFGEMKIEIRGTRSKRGPVGKNE
jgi:hypothetical protein